MASRLELHTVLKELLENDNVYYQPPESIKMNYPAIKYSKSKLESRYANDSKYSKLSRYEILVIDKRPDNAVIDKILALKYSSYDRHYTADNLHHDVIILYY